MSFKRTPWAVSAAVGLVLAALGTAIASEPDEQEASTKEAAARPLTIVVDPRVELVSVVFRLAGNPEYNRARIDSYARDVDSWFAKQREHPVVKRARELRRNRGVSFDACMSMAVHLTDAERLNERVPFDPVPLDLDARWKTEEAREFLRDLRAFATESRFREFLAGHQELYRLAQSRMKALLDRDGHLEWFDAFFGGRPESRFVVAVGLLNGPNNYGVRCRPAVGAEELYCILGAWAKDDKGQPTFGRGVVETVVHEFCHSYVNAIIDRHEADLKAAGEKLFARVASAMRKQAYGNWKTMLYESLVRACTLRYMRQYMGPGAAGLKAAEEQGRSFTWVPDLARLLEQYETKRETYPTLEAFAPRIIAFFNDQAKRPAAIASVDGASTGGPRIVSITPRDGAADVDPDLAEIRVVFDQPMRDGSWSLVGGGDEFPEITSKPSYDSSRTTWTVPMRLKPSWSYRFQLNSPRFRGFRSARGVPLEPVVVRFRTGGARK